MSKSQADTQANCSKYLVTIYKVIPLHANLQKHPKSFLKRWKVCCVLTDEVEGALSYIISTAYIHIHIVFFIGKYCIIYILEYIKPLF